MTTIACVITCKGRLHHVQQTLPLIVAQGTSEVIVVDYGCPDRTGEWIEANFPDVTVVRVTDDPEFHLARARNIGAAQATSDWLLFVDADVLVADSWHAWMQDELRPGNFYRRDLVGGMRDADTHGTVICSRADFIAIGGYDEVYRGWGGEDEDLYQRLILAGVAEHIFPAIFATGIRHGDEERAGWCGLQNRQDVIDMTEWYRLAKIETLKALGLTGDLPLDLRVHYMEITRRVMMQWFADGRSRPLRLTHELKTAGGMFSIDLEATANGTSVDS